MKTAYEKQLALIKKTGKRIDRKNEWGTSSRLLIVLKLTGVVLGTILVWSAIVHFGVY